MTQPHDALSAEDWTDGLSDGATALAVAVRAHPGSVVTLPVAAAGAGMSSGQAQRHLAALLAADVVRRDGGSYRLTDAASRPQDADPDAVVRILSWYLHAAAGALDAMGMSVLHVPLAGPVPDPLPDIPGGFAQGHTWLLGHHDTLVAAAQAAADLRLNPAAWQLSSILCELYALSNDTDQWSRIVELGHQAALDAGDLVGQGVMLETWGKLFTQRGLTRRGQDLQHRALAMRVSAGDLVGRARSLNALGLVAWREGRLDAACERFRAAEKLASQAGAARLAAITRVNRAGVTEDLGETEALLRDAVEYFGDRAPLYAANAMADLAENLRGQERMQEALDAAHMALDQAQNLGVPAFIAAGLTQVALASAGCGQTGLAPALLREAASLYRALGDLQRYPDTLAAAGQAYEALGQDAQAQVLRDRARQLRAQLREHQDSHPPDHDR